MIFTSLILTLFPICFAHRSFDDRNRYAVINCIANQLRYPNSHTHYWSCVLLYLFTESSNDAVKEQVRMDEIKAISFHALTQPLPQFRLQECY